MGKADLKSVFKKLGKQEMLKAVMEIYIEESQQRLLLCHLNYWVRPMTSVFFCKKRFYVFYILAQKF